MHYGIEREGLATKSVVIPRSFDRVSTFRVKIFFHFVSRTDECLNESD